MGIGSVFDPGDEIVRSEETLTDLEKKVAEALPDATSVSHYPTEFDPHDENFPIGLSIEFPSCKLIEITHLRDALEEMPEIRTIDLIWVAAHADCVNVRIEAFLQGDHPTLLL